MRSVLFPRFKYCKIIHWCTIKQLSRHKFSKKHAPQGEYIYGVQPVLSALISNRRKINQLYLSPTEHKQHDKVPEIASRFRDITHKQPITQNLHELNLKTDAKPHQGVVLDASPINFNSILPLKKTTNKRLVFLALHKIQDPQNFGAIIRSAVFFGVEGIVVGETDRCPITPAVAKASSGATEFIDMFQTVSLPQFLWVF